MAAPVPRSEWLFHPRGLVLVVQAYGDLDAENFRYGRGQIAAAVRAGEYEKVIVDMRRATVLLTPGELTDVVRETAQVSYVQPVGMLVPEGFDLLAFHHSFAMANRGLTRLWWTDPADALDWAGLDHLPAFKSP
jgi:hypothetical protein